MQRSVNQEGWAVAKFGSRTPFGTNSNHHGSAAGRSNFSSPVMDGFGNGEFCSPNVVPDQYKAFGPVFGSPAVQGRQNGATGVSSPSYRPSQDFQSNYVKAQPCLQPPRYQSPPCVQSGGALQYSPSATRFGYSSVSQRDWNETSDWSSFINGGTERSASFPSVRINLPSWTLDPVTQRVCISFSDVLQHGLLTTFATDKLGCHFLQNEYPSEGAVREKLAKEVLDNKTVFESLCGDVFGNFFIQCVIEKATDTEMKQITERLTGNMFEMCLHRYSCRVVQKAVEHLPASLSKVLLIELHCSDLVKLSIDQNSNHVIQKIMSCFPLSDWTFLVNFFIDDVFALLAVAEDKYGCRVIQLSIQLLTEERQKSDVAADLLDKMISHLHRQCERMASNEFANYVIQHVIKDAQLTAHRDAIIQDCILGNILSMAQEKFASHVVEVAIQHAPTLILRDIMDEIFDGYVPHPDTKDNAVDIMLFHQYGNYVVQRMLLICVEALQQYRQGRTVPHMKLFEDWLVRLEKRVQFHRSRLTRYSSGKKILAILDSVTSNAQKDISAPTAAPVRHSLN